jgi:low affinity Fe/Cu permease
MHNTKHESEFSRRAMSLARWVGTPMSILIHTFLFIGIFILHFFGVEFEEILLILTTLVSLEAIYLSLFIQMTVNKHAESLEDVEEDIDEINENMEEISDDMDDVHEDVEVLETSLSTSKKNNTPSLLGYQYFVNL